MMIAELSLLNLTKLRVKTLNFRDSALNERRKIMKITFFKEMLRELFIHKPIDTKIMVPESKLAHARVKIFLLGKKEEVKDAISNWISSIKNTFMARIISKILRFQSKMAYIRNKKNNAFQSLLYLASNLSRSHFSEIGPRMVK